MSRTQRIIITLREKFPGNDTDEGINFSHAAKAIGVSRTTLINWLRKENVEIKTSNWESLAKATGYQRSWLELEDGPQKLGQYGQSKPSGYAISDGGFRSCPNIQYIKWSQLGTLLDSHQPLESNNMNQGRVIQNPSIAVELESNQFSPYASAGETIFVEPNAPTHGMKVLVVIKNEYYILTHDKLQTRFSDLNGNEISLESEPSIIGTITQIFGASRKG